MKNIKYILLLSILLLTVNINGQHRFVPVWTGNGYMHMNFYIFSATINDIGLGAGDEIAVFDGVRCVGAVRLTAPIDLYVSIIASMNDPTTPEIDGYTHGNQITFKVWDSRNRKEYSEPGIDVVYLRGNGRFALLSTAEVRLSIQDRSPQNLRISLTGENVILRWNEVTDAIGYRVYSAEEPEIDAFTPDNTGAFEGTIWRAPLPPQKARFYLVKALFE